MRAVCFLDNGRFCHWPERNKFFMKIEKKGLPIYFFGQYSVGLTELMFFGPKMDVKEVFHKLFAKKYMKAHYF